MPVPADDVFTATIDELAAGSDADAPDRKRKRDRDDEEDAQDVAGELAPTAAAAPTSPPRLVKKAKTSNGGGWFSRLLRGGRKP